MESTRSIFFVVALLAPAAGIAQTPAGATPAVKPAALAPLTARERVRLYLTQTYGPVTIVRAAASGGISQWADVPKEWGQGADAYGQRVGNAMAKRALRGALEHGAAALLREDNRYRASGRTGFWPRTRYAIAQIFLARNTAGGRHFAYSRFGGTLGASFLSRLWQPPSTSSPGDAANNFGINIGVDAGFNVFHEFWPDIKKRLRKK